MNNHDQIDYETPIFSMGEIADFLAWLGCAANLDVENDYYINQWFEYLDFIHAEDEVQQAVKH